MLTCSATAQGVADNIGERFKSPSDTNRSPVAPRPWSQSWSQFTPRPALFTDDHTDYVRAGRGRWGAGERRSALLESVLGPRPHSMDRRHGRQGRPGRRAASTALDEDVTGQMRALMCVPITARSCQPEPDTRNSHTNHAAV